MTKGQVLEAAVEARAVLLPELVAWAEREIVLSAKAPSWLIGVSLSRDADSAVQALRSSGQAGGPLALEAAVFLFTEAARLGRSSPRRTIQRAFFAVVDEDAPAWLKEIVYQLDEDLSRALYAGSHEAMELAPRLAELRTQLLAASTAVRTVSGIVEECRRATPTA